MANYANPLARDETMAPIQEVPAPFPAKARYANENGLASSVMTVSQDTTEIEIMAQTAAVAMRWVATTDTQASVVAVAGATANYDHIIPSGMVRRFVIPRERTGTSSIVGANIKNGLYQRYAVKSLVVGSVLSAEY